MLENYISYEMGRLKYLIGNGMIPKLVDAEIRLEKLINTDHTSHHTPFRIKGIADRVESISGTHHILDYKTGKVDTAKLKLDKGIDAIFEKENFDKARQILCYIYMYSATGVSPENCKAAFYSFVNHKNGWLYLDNNEELRIDKETLTSIENALLNWREKVYETSVFEHNPKSEYCVYCRRKSGSESAAEYQVLSE